MSMASLPESSDEVRDAPAAVMEVMIVNAMKNPLSSTRLPIWAN
jgi:hypothetical protein